MTHRIIFWCVVSWLFPVIIGVFASFDLSAIDPRTWEPLTRAVFAAWVLAAPALVVNSYEQMSAEDERMQ